MRSVVVADCLEAMRAFPPASFDAVVTDPPYGIRFMGQAWDGSDIEREVVRRAVLERVAPARAGTLASPAQAAGTYDVSSTANRAFQAWTEAWAAEALRVLKPGGYLLCFAGTRTYHRMACGVEDAGFEVRDCLAWMYGQGFPKSLNVGCLCGGDAETECDVRSPGLREEDVSEAKGAGDGAEVLFKGVQESGAPAERPVPAEGKLGREERLLEGRGHALAEEGELSADQVRPSPGVGGSDGPEGRLRHGAPDSDGGEDRAAAAAGGGRPSSEPRSAGQPDREPRALADEPGSQAVGGWPICPRCGLPRAGLGTGLKPAFEPVVVARRPFAGTVAGNVARYGTGAINVDGCRIRVSDPDRRTVDGRVRVRDNAPRTDYGEFARDGENETMALHDLGRWPANVLLDEDAAAQLDEETGDVSVGHWPASRPTNDFGFGHSGQHDLEERREDAGGPSRFFYTAKVSRAERNAGLDGFEKRPILWSSGEQNPGSFQADGTDRSARNHHPTVKPVALMRWLVRLVSPPGGLVLDPFAGSGSTGVACALEGVRFAGVERDPGYAEIAEARIGWWAEHGEAALDAAAGERERDQVRASGQTDIFDVLA